MPAVPKKTTSARKPPPRIQYHVAPTTEQETVISHRHVKYSEKDGRMSASTSTIQTTRSREDHQLGSELGLQQRQGQAGIELNVDEEPSRTDISAENEDISVDAAYLAHIDDVYDGEDRVDKLKRVRPKGDEVLRQWEVERDLFLQELNQLEGRGSWASESCVECEIGKGEFECVSCGDREMRCEICTVSRHASSYLHRIRKWNGLFFERSTLRELGLRKQLGHRVGERCVNPEPCKNGEFWVIDSFGLHNVALDFCGCGKEDQRHTVQLLRARLFPATVTNPQSAATFDALKAFEMLSYESKLSGFEFYQAQSRLTDNAGLDIPNDRYLSFMRMAREWRHLKMLRWAGRAHDPGGVAATKEGECAVLCPACPHPDMNMEPGWEDAPAEKQFLHARFVALDANFRLKRKAISSEQADPSLSHGWAYFVEENTYKAHIEARKNEVEPKSNCSRHDAVNLSNSKPNRGHAATGIAKVVCSRHDMKLPCSVGDLQFSERYCNMDFLFYRCTQTSKVKYYIVSYDIACQWSIHLRERMFELDHDFFLFDGTRYVRFLVPKFHLPAHIAPCRTQFSFNYTRGVGRTDGEAPERGWSDINPLAPSTRECGPGLRKDILEAHFGDHNWRKVISLCISTKRKIFAAALDMAEHVIEHDEFCETIPDDIFDEWTAQIVEWEDDPSKPNPFDATVEGPTQVAVRRELAEEEAHDLAQGRDFTLDDRVSPSVLIASGLDIEAEQRSLKVEASRLWQHAQDRQKTKLLLRSNALQRKIEAWSKFQLLYCPAVDHLRSCSVTLENEHISIQPHDIPLWLPSQIKGQAPVSDQLRRIEWKLRHAQAFDALEKLRHNLQVRAYLYKFKDRFVRGQGANTRARNSISSIQARVDAAAEEYRVAYDALIALGAMLLEYSWQNLLLPLKDEDIRDLSEGRGGESEGRRTMSWIWRMAPNEHVALESSEFLRDRIRVEFAKSRARAERFTEEVELLTVEMSRILRFFQHKATQWSEKGTRDDWGATTTSQAFAEGHRAYAERQAAMYRGLHDRCIQQWKDVPAHIARMQAIIMDPSLAQPGEFDNSSASKQHNEKQRSGAT